jgi:acyl carrier protein
MNDFYERIAALSPKKRALLAVRLDKQTPSLDRQNVSGEARPAANPAQAPTASQLRRFLMDKLPDYMVPSSFVMLDALPLTPGGKVNHQALSALNATGAELENAFAAPRTPLESLIAEVWREALKVDRVGIHDNFFDLGGHSLLAMRAVADIEKKSGLRINPGEMFGQTLGQLAAACEERWATRPQPSESKGVRRKLFHTIKRVVSSR